MLKSRLEEHHCDLKVVLEVIWLYYCIVLIAHTVCKLWVSRLQNKCKNAWINVTGLAIFGINDRQK